MNTANVIIEMIKAENGQYAIGIMKTERENEYMICKLVSNGYPQTLNPQWTEYNGSMYSDNDYDDEYTRRDFLEGSA